MTKPTRANNAGSQTGGRMNEEGYRIKQNPAILNAPQHSLEIGKAMLQLIDEYHFYVSLRNQLADWHFSQFLSLCHV
jgi:hypothetical protein